MTNISKQFSQLKKNLSYFLCFQDTSSLDLMTSKSFLSTPIAWNLCGESNSTALGSSP